jgi:DUF4097 and DUF4098 domain-containing protein YvlB
MKQLLLLLLLIPGLTVLAQDKKTPYLTKQLSADNIKDVEVKTSGGYINVSAVPASEARIEVYVKANNGKDLTNDEIKQRLDEKYELTVDVANGKLTAIAKHKNNRDNDWKRSLSISFAVFVPKNVTTDLATSGGSIDIRGLSGSQNFATSGGSLHVEDVSGTVNGRTSGGSIEVSGASDDIDLMTSGGSIDAKDCKGKIRLTTSGGSINLKNLDGNINAVTSGGSISGKKIAGELDTHTSGGNIRLDEVSCTLDASTSGGHIDISMTALGKHVKLRNSGGNIDLEIPAGKGLDLDLTANRVKVDELTNFSGKVKESQVEGKMNGGGTSISATSGSGRVSLAFK